MGVSGKTSKASSVVAAICIAIYIAAIAFGAVRIVVSIGDRKDKAEREFQDLADRATSSAVFLGFMSEAYQETIRDFLGACDTLLGIIITGPNGENVFEKYPGSGIVWAGDFPRLKTGAGFPAEPFHLPLRVEGQRNVNIQAVYSYIDYDLLLIVLRDTLVAVLAALAIALITLIIEMTKKKETGSAYSKTPVGAAGEYKPVRIPVPSAGAGTDTRYAEKETAGAEWETASPDDMEQSIMDDMFLPNETGETSAFGDVSFEEKADPDIPDIGSTEDNPQGLYTPRGNIGWESYTKERLNSEIHRCASSEQDLTLLAMEFKGDEKISDALYRQFADEAVEFFSMRDLIFEYGENGISVIVPSADLEQGMAKAEEFRSRIIAKLPESFKGRAGLCIGLSSRSGRLIEAERLTLEASTAVKKAMADPVSPIIAFKSDPEKYREFIKGHH